MFEMPRELRASRKTPTVSERRIVVLDSSVGVKWIKPEPGRDEALSLLREHRDGTARVVVASHFVHEVVAVAVKRSGAPFGRTTWESLTAAELTTIGLDDRLAAAAFEQCVLLNCTFYDALAPALAEQLGGTLYSADARAHARFSGVQLI